MRQRDVESLAFVRVRHERLAIAVLSWALTHVLKTGFKVHRRIHLLMARIKDL